MLFRANRHTGNLRLLWVGRGKILVHSRSHPRPFPCHEQHTSISSHAPLAFHSQCFALLLPWGKGEALSEWTQLILFPLCHVFCFVAMFVSWTVMHQHHTVEGIITQNPIISSFDIQNEAVQVPTQRSRRAHGYTFHTAYNYTAIAELSRPRCQVARSNPRHGLNE